MKRRPFLTRVLGTAGAVGAGIGLPVLGAGCDRKKKEAPAAEAPYVVQRFDAAQQRTLEALFDTLIPPNDPPGSPGGAEVGLVVFLDKQLGEDEFRRFEPFVKDGLRVLDRLARRDHGADFHAVGPAERTALLGALQIGAERPGGYPGETFFQLVHTFALEGFYGAPFHGGNAEGRAWRWAGISMACPPRPDEPPPVSQAS